MKVKVKKLHPDAILPTYATDGSGCFDIYAHAVNGIPESDKKIIDKYDHGITFEKDMWDTERCVFNTGVSFEIPQDHIMLIFSRSGHAFKNNIRLANCVGVIDSDYRGELKIKLTNDAPLALNEKLKISNGDRIAQGMIIPIPKIEFEQVEELSETERGAGGFGSTGA